MIAENIAQPESKISSSANRQKVDSMNQLAFEIRNSDTQRAITLSKDAQKISLEINYPDGNATALANEGFCYVQVTDYELALEKLFEALRIFEELKNEKGIAQVQYNLALVYFRFSDFNSGLDRITKALSYYQKINDPTEMARCYFQMGFLYHSLNDNTSAIEYMNQSLEMNRSLKNKAGEAAAMMGLGQGYLHFKEYEKSKTYLLESLDIREEIKDWRGYAASLNAYMTVCIETGKFKEAEEISLKGIKLATELSDKMGISRFMLGLGKIYFRQNKMEEAERTLLEAQTIAEKISLRMALVPAHLAISELYKSKGDYEKALRHYEQYHKVREEMMNVDAAMKAKSAQLLIKIENAQKEAEINRLKNVELKNAYDEIAEKNKDITDSINYARRIQHALLASDEILKKNLKEHFIFFKPKDIVSGDFYWAVEKNGCFYLAVCDSTGHGVPGAFMSLLNISFLNEAISEKNISQPNEVFNHTRKKLVENISSDGAQDGMDGILMCFDKNTKEISYAGAHNAPVLAAKGTLEELNADNMPIGLADRLDSFKHQTLNSQSGNVLYLYTDGYADQFGGPKGKKFKYKQLQEKLLAISDRPLAEQKAILEKTFEDWKGNNEQTDDVLIIGIKI
jgi:serine phosphatase RsbU (regulator of sigma subunit)